MLSILHLLLLFLPAVDLYRSTRLKRLSAYDPANLKLSQLDDRVPGYRLRPYRPKLSVALTKEARVTRVNGKDIPLWFGDGFVRIPKRPVISMAQVIPSSAEQNVEVHFGGGTRVHYPYPRVSLPFRSPQIRTTTFPPVMVTLGAGRTPPPRTPFEAMPAMLFPASSPNKGTLIVFMRKKRPHRGRSTPLV